MDAPGESLCARCAKHQKTCCQTKDIYVTPGDLRRIERATDLESFWAFKIAGPEYLDQDDDPRWGRLVFRPDGSRRVLLREDNGDCTFLGPTGCTLSLETRPLVCRLFPHDYNEAGLSTELSDGCPTELLAKDQSLLTVLDMRQSDAVRWHRQLYRELEMEMSDADRPDLRSEE